MPKKEAPDDARDRPWFKTSTTLVTKGKDGLEAVVVPDSDG